jgi:hypothetical protein
MTDKQVQALLAKKDSGNPLYLLTALEELRTLGTYEEITERIEELPDRVRDLFGWIFRRLEEDQGFRNAQGQRIGPELVRGFASLMSVSRYGLSQTELMELLAPGDPEAKPPIPPDPQGNVATLLRLLRPFLMHRGELLDCYHSHFSRAAESFYLVQEENRQAAHARLANYFQGKADPDNSQCWKGESIRPFIELPFHLSQSNFEALTQLLFDYNWLQAKTNKALVHELIQDYGSVLSELQ